MKLSLLDIVQDIHNDLDLDEINGIDDTVESVQVAQIVKTSYFELISSRNWPHLKRTMRFNSTASTSTPTHLQLPDTVKEVIMLSYNCRTESNPTKDSFKELKYLQSEDFIRFFNKRNTDKDNVIKITDFGGGYIYLMNDKQPEYYTSFDDEYVVCDSYDASLESTLQSTNTQALVYAEPTWTHEDDFTPDLPSEAFSLLIEEAKSTASMALRQVANEKAEQKSRRQTKWLSRKSWRVDGGVRYPDYGRKTYVTSNSYNRSPMFDKT